MDWGIGGALAKTRWEQSGSPARNKGISMRRPSQWFAYCPRCGCRTDTPAQDQPFRCGSCGWVYYFNPAIAAAAFLRRPDGRVLFIRRAKDPAQGKLALPGGFVDIGETAEEALEREIEEEVGMKAADLVYLGSHPNDYVFREVAYPVLDLFFRGQVGQGALAQALDGVQSVVWLEAREVDPDALAFPSLRQGLGAYRAWLDRDEEQTRMRFPPKGSDPPPQ